MSPRGCTGWLRPSPRALSPPILVYQLGDAYFVIDGHHRVAVARRKGTEQIDAEITELRTDWTLPADADRARTFRSTDTTS